MAPELGIFALILAFLLSLSQAFFGLAGAWKAKPAWMAVSRPAVTGQFVFVARDVLAKHDEKYMPPEVAKALKESGRWQEGEGTKK